MKKPTIYEIKKATSETAPMFFCRDNMGGEHQTLKDFKVVKSPKDNIYVYCQKFDRNGYPSGVTFRQFEDNKLKFLDIPAWNVREVLDFIEKN
jgi:hypothetical protein